ncbi:unnamed protein product [Meloidogyne enterolobii]|uniref:Uncharacterized protein n=2 Tax=Meloidogyne enterolobii TaxID=390850 RepID=A0A6V7WL29_MELEN|nr:unnamed protein product [Meloidogyne enterolobii]
MKIPCFSLAFPSVSLHFLNSLQFLHIFFLPFPPHENYSLFSRGIALMHCFYYKENFLQIFFSKYN